MDQAVELFVIESKSGRKNTGGIPDTPNVDSGSRSTTTISAHRSRALPEPSSSRQRTTYLPSASSDGTTSGAESVNSPMSMIERSNTYSTSRDRGRNADRLLRHRRFRSPSLRSEETVASSTGDESLLATPGSASVSEFAEEIATTQELVASILWLSKRLLGSLLIFFLVSNLVIKFWRIALMVLSPLCQLPVVSIMDACLLVNAPTPTVSDTTILITTLSDPVITPVLTATATITITTTMETAPFTSSASSIFASDTSDPKTPVGPLEGDPQPGESYTLHSNANFPDLITIQTKYVGKFLRGLAIGHGLSLELKNAESAIIDLVNRVKRYPASVFIGTDREEISQSLPLVWKLISFANDMREVDNDLQSLHDKLEAGIDEISMINVYALSTLQAYATPDEKLITHAFENIMNVSSAQLTQLMADADHLEGTTDYLIPSLIELYTLLKEAPTTAATLQLSSNPENVLADLWMHFDLQAQSDHCRRDHPSGESTNYWILKRVGVHRLRVIAHLVHIFIDLEEWLEKLGAMAVDKIASKYPDDSELPAVGDRSKGVRRIPVDMHIKSLQMGLERLKQEKSRARALRETVIRKVQEGKVNELESMR
ncbi:hypothetical protein AX16_008720 [Volvariella volvacea WC 439]|nr:hypothetical protein AX16_008720 [Volvariella volvacea WC 439]